MCSFFCYHKGTRSFNHITRYENSFNYKKFLCIMIVLIVTLVIDTSIVKVYDLIDKFFIPEQGKIMLFSINSSLCLLLGFIIIKYIKNSFKTNRLNRTLNANLFYRISLISLLILGALMAALIFQQFYNSYYNTSISISIITLWNSSSFFNKTINSIFFLV